MSFQFKKFKIEHRPEVFKFGTDAALLAVLAPIENSQRILEIGTGSGVVTLMMAQRNSTATYLGIDISEAAISLAIKNHSNYPIPANISFKHTSLQDFTGQALFDHVISNPPFFENSTKSPKALKNSTRHTDILPLKILLENSKRLTNQSAKTTIIYPSRYINDIKAHCESLNLWIKSVTFIGSKPEKPIKRVLVTIQKTACKTVEKTLFTEGNHKGYSEEIFRKFEPFYLYL